MRGEAKRAAVNGGCLACAEAERQERLLCLPPALLEAPLDALTRREQEEILRIGRTAGLKLYHFKRSHGELPRVKAVLGFLKTLAYDSLLDVGSGRGAFLWPLMDAFPTLRVSSVDILPHRVAFLDAVRLGGAERLSPICADICSLSGENGAFDVVSLLEVLEHIPDAAAAVSSAVRLARRYVVVSVPSAADDNPEHIHLLTKEALTELFAAAGVRRLRFGAVNGHLLLFAAKEGE